MSKKKFNLLKSSKKKKSLKADGNQVKVDIIDEISTEVFRHEDQTFYTRFDEYVIQCSWKQNALLPSFPDVK